MKTDSGAVPVIGDRGNYFGSVSEIRTISGIVMAVTDYAEDTAIPSHCHEFPSIFLALGGAHTARTAGRDIRYEQGDVGFYQRGHAHSVKVRAGSRAFNIEVTPAARCFTQFCERDSLETVSSAHVLSLYREFTRTDSATPLAVAGLGLLIVADLCRSRTQDAPPWVRDAVAWLGDTNDPLSPGETASLLGISDEEFVAGFYRYTGYSPAAYLRRRRLDNAARRLTHSTESISRIAIEAGFYDHPHFCRAFLAQIGFTPSAYRKLFSR